MDVLREFLLICRSLLRRCFGSFRGTHLPFEKEIELIKEKDEGKPIILVIKGIYGWLYGLEKLEDYFSRRGKIVIELFCGFGSVASKVKEAQKKIEFLLKRTAIPISVVGYSQGGLIVLEFLRRYPEAVKKIDKIVLMGCPTNIDLFYRLSLLEKLEPGITGEARRIVKGFLQKFDNNLKNLFCFAGEKDFVVPAEVSRLFFYPYFMIKNIGHMALLEDNKSLEYLYGSVFQNCLDRDGKERIK